LSCRLRTLLSSLAFLLLAASCDRHRVDRTFTDDFKRDAVGPNYVNTGGPYRLERGRLVFENAHNHPLWLDRRLPDDVRVDLDVTPLSADGDVKVELYGDGKSYESDDAVRRDLQYTDTGYLFIFGGWHNQLSTLVKEREHAWQYDPSVPRRRDVRAEPGRTYHWTLLKRGGHLAWFMDNRLFLAWDDPAPLHGEGHDRFCFTGWEAGAAYTNLRIAPLGPDDPLTP
jgi:hypothetical protein